MENKTPRSAWTNRDHLAVLASPRRIILQADVRQLAPDLHSMGLDNLLAWIFHNADQPGSQVDSIFWDTEYFFPHIDDRYTTDDYRQWQRDGVDIMAAVLAAARARNLECVLLHRFSEVERPSGIARYTGKNAEQPPRNRIKEEHPDWVLDTWWWQGLWNLESDGLKEFKVKLLSKIIHQYDFDGICIDYSRHVPCLPCGRQWEERAHVTAFMRMLRASMQEIAEQKKHPLLVGAKVPENEKGCRTDGFDIAAWSREGLVDCFVVGARTVNVDLAWFRKMSEGTPIRLFPAYEDAQPTDGYHLPGIEFFRGLCDNWWHQGADGIVLFNFSQGTREMMEQFHFPELMLRTWHPAHLTACRECGSPETMRNKDHLFVVERRGGFPYAAGYFNRNDDARLPAHIPNDGTALKLDLNLFFNPSREPSSEPVRMKFVLCGAEEGREIFDFRVNGCAAENMELDYHYKDAQIFATLPTPPSGAVIYRGGDYSDDPNQHLLACTFEVDPRRLKCGANRFEIRCRVSRHFIIGENLTVEKAELLWPETGR